MTLLNILHYPNPKLRNKALPVAEVNEEIVTIVDNMFETMYEAPGIGLAAIQVDIPKRIITIDISESRDEPLTVINPEILEKEGEIEFEEGCLSVPEVFEVVTRAQKIRFRALNERGETYEMMAEDLLAVCVQHEIDHLDGKLFVDKLSLLKREVIRKRAKKQMKKEVRL